MGESGLGSRLCTFQLLHQACCKRLIWVCEIRIKLKILATLSTSTISSPANVALSEDEYMAEMNSDLPGHACPALEPETKMKSAIRRIATLATVATTTAMTALTAAPALSAAQFGQQEVDQSRFAAIAAPVGSTSHQLLILEQINNSRLCWQDVGNGVVEPLLLNFNFTGICGRSTDSNGYSVRVGGQDMGWRYSLRMVRQGSNLKLIAAPTTDRSLPELEIGSTTSTSSNFLQVQLNPGWRLTKRVYNGQTIGHVYLTHDQDLNTLVASAAPRPSTPAPAPVQPSQPVVTPPIAAPPIATTPVVTTPVTTTPVANAPVANAPTPSRPLPQLPPPPNVSNPAVGGPSSGSSVVVPTVPVFPTPIPSATPSPVFTGPAPAPSPIASQQGFSHRVVVPANTPLEQDRVRRTVPGAFRTTINGQIYMQTGLFRTQAEANQSQVALRQQNLMASVLAVDTVSQPSLPSQPAPSQADLSYRVVVLASTPLEQDRVRRVAPGAFRTTIDGRTYMQAGLFRSRAEADRLQATLRQQNLQASVLTSTAPIPQPSIPTNTTQPNQSQVPRGRTVVVIDPGHGGRDPGAVGIGGLREADVVLSISQQVASILERQGVQAILTRRDNSGLELAPRVQMAQRANANLFVSIHANAISMSRPDVNGVETFHYSASSANLARSIQNSIVSSTGMVNRGVKTARFYVLTRTSMPAVLVETGFVTGRNDAARLASPAFRTQMAEAIARGIMQHVQGR